MELTEKSERYPVFEPNQILSDGHLNQAFDYLDEQERLTRANLIGIGIVCGLNIHLEVKSQTEAVIYLSKGCGITSEGYLIVESEDVPLISYRNYELPSAPDYHSFKDSSSPPVQYSLWELFPTGEPDTTLLSPNFLNDKAVMLFLELKKEGLRNCSPNNCDDKGAKVTATVRRLLVSVSDLRKIIAEAKSLNSGLTSDELEETLLARLNLPDPRLPRYDVPNKRPGTTEQVLAAFLSAFSSGIVRNTGSVLSSAYEAFKPLLKEEYPTDPFAGFSGKFGFLDNIPENMTQVLFLQYYYDFFDDLIKAYNEFRWKGTALLCSCCPPDKLFPRHLMLGVLDENSDVYRQKFLTSPAVSRCEKHVNELKQLFQRMVTMIDIFTDAPPMPKTTSHQVSRASEDEQIRITPSKLGDVPLSDKAIPYYYKLPMYLFWDPEKTRQGRAKQNLSYRSYEYNPSAPDALRFGLELYNFLRIEGHLGKDYQKVLERLLYLKDIYRLPIEIIALRTGTFDKNIAVDLSKEKCRLQDLEAMYDVKREEILSTLSEGTMYLYDVTIKDSNLPGGTPQLPLLKKYASNFLYKTGTVGAWYEKYLTLFQSIPYIDVDQNKIDDNALLGVYCTLFRSTFPPDSMYQAHIVSIYYFTKLAEVLPASLDALGYSDFENKYQDLMGLIRYFRSDAVAMISAEFQKFIPQEDLIDHFDQVLFSCKLEPVKAIHEEYESRLREIKQKQFLSFFLQKNPGIQHKAGVPLGGTFIIVYHQNPAPDRNLNISAGVKADSQRVREVADITSITPPVGDKQTALIESINRISSNTNLATDPDVKIVISSLIDRISGIISNQPGSRDRAFKIISEVASDLKEGTVIADFFLPYLCCSDCSPVQFILQKIPPTFTAQIGCTNSDNLAEVTIVTKGGEAPYDYKLDEHPFQAFTGKISMSKGPHTIIIRDNEGVESVPQSLTVPDPLAIRVEEYTEDVNQQSYTVSFNIDGGNPPYNAKSGTITNGRFNSTAVKSGETISVTIIDNAGCQVTKGFTHTVKEPCKLPCDGIAMRRGYRFSIPFPVPEENIKEPGFSFVGPTGNTVNLTKEVVEIITTATGREDFMKQINDLIANYTGSSDWLTFDYKSTEHQFGLDTWEIEYFTCLKFELFITLRDGDLSSTFIKINPEGSEITVKEGQNSLAVSIPAFNIVQINKCDPNRPSINPCKEVDLKLEINKEPSENEVVLAATPSGNAQPVAYLWEVQDGIPPMSNEQKARFTFKEPELNTKYVRLTAYTQNGCRVIATTTINLDI